MSDTDVASSGSASLTDAQLTWAMTFCNIDTPPNAGDANANPARKDKAKPGGVSASISDAPGAPSSLAMRGRPTALDRSRDDAVRKIAGESSDVPRQHVEDELNEFLTALGKAQKTKTVRVTDKVLSVDRVLHDGLGANSPPLLKDGDTRDYEPADLARKMAGALPDPVPGGNVLSFRKLKPVEVAREGTVTDQLHRKYQEERDRLIHRLPKSIQGMAEKAIDAAVEKGIPLAAEQIFSGIGAGSGLQDDVKQFVGEWSKKVIGSDDARN
jgi:hypothetical protein